MMESPVTAKRRSPNQARARDKLELIYEASIRILNKQGLEGLTTNRIAEVAGISIGTLYQYFSNKQEILVALGQREIDATVAKVTELFFKPSEEPDKLRLLVRAFLKAFDGRHQVRKILLDIALTQQGILGLDQSVSQITRALNSPIAMQFFKNARHLNEMDVFVLSSAVTGVIRSALVRDTAMLSHKDLEDNIIILIRSYINQIKSDVPEQL
ncbi:AcrR family transcriptional regulator [Oxalobacteraceae bacterium GrIS 2.11]